VFVQRRGCDADVAKEDAAAKTELGFDLIHESGVVVEIDTSREELAIHDLQLTLSLQQVAQLRHGCGREVESVGALKIPLH
jgi:hypothetical protein